MLSHPFDPLSTVVIYKTPTAIVPQPFPQDIWNLILVSFHWEFLFMTIHINPNRLFNLYINYWVWVYPQKGRAKRGCQTWIPVHKSFLIQGFPENILVNPWTPRQRRVLYLTVQGTIQGTIDCMFPEFWGFEKTNTTTQICYQLITWKYCFQKRVPVNPQKYHN